MLRTLSTQHVRRLTPVWIALLMLGACSSEDRPGETPPPPPTPTPPTPSRVLQSSTYLGGNGEDYSQGIAVDAGGNVYAVGGSESGSSFPATVGTCGPSEDGVVSKFSPAGSLVWARCLGGSAKDYVHSVTVDDQGSVYVSGVTWSSNLAATARAYQTALRGTKDDFVAKLSSSGAVQWMTYLGGSGEEHDRSGIFVDGQHNVWLTGATASRDFPTTGGVYQRTLRGPQNGYVVKLSPDGRSILASTYLGGGGTDSLISGIVVHTDGTVYVGGFTNSTDFPTTSEGFQPRYRGGKLDGVVVRLSATLSSLVFSTYLGGTGEDWISENHGFTVDAAGRPILSGMTWSTDFPATAAAMQKANKGDIDTFVAILSTDGTSLRAATYLGGPGRELNSGVSYDDRGNVYVTGETESAGFPVSADALQATLRSSARDAFVTKLSPDLSNTVFSSYVGGSQQDRGRAIAVNRQSGMIVIWGDSLSDDFPTSAEAPHRTRTGGKDYVLFIINPGTTAARAEEAPDASGGLAEAPPRTEQQVFTSLGVRYRVDLLARNLNLPVALAPTPDGRLFVAERSGTVSILEEQSRAVHVALNREDLGEQEIVLHSIIAHPLFRRNQFVYLLYTALDGGEAVMRLTRLREVRGTLGEPTVLLDGLPSSDVAPAGAVTFGDDGKLYVAFDQPDDGRAVDAETLTGTVLRLNEDGTAPGDAKGRLSAIGLAGRQPVGLVDRRAVDGALWLIARSQGHDGQRQLSAPRVRVLVRPSAAGVAMCRGAVCRDSLFIAAREDERLERWRFDTTAGGWRLEESLLTGWFGRLESIANGPPGVVYVGTGNSRPADAVGNDVVLRIAPE